ncbi:MAG: dihydrolipoamide acetyltransferase family protein [Acetobacteraceae bacterium]
MAERVIKLPDVGEGIAEAELVEVFVKVGDVVREDAPLAAVMTDKATVEIPSPADGEVLWIGAEIGDVVAVGSELVRLEVAGDAAEPGPAGRGGTRQGAPVPIAAPAPAPSQPRAETPQGASGAGPDVVTSTPPAEARRQAADTPAQPRGETALSPATPRRGGGGPPRPEGERPLASPAVRLRAREAGIDLRRVPGTGPAGRITHEDLDGFLTQDIEAPAASIYQVRTAVQDVRVAGLRRRIAERMALAHTRIPHITYVEEVDVTALEALRTNLNERKRAEQPRLTLLPFLMRAIVRAVTEQPELNALYDDEAGVVHVHAGVHIGIATQTASGLMVPVVRHAEALDLWGSAMALGRVAEVARNGTATREELSGSTITITSLGAMGGLVSTPIINHPEVAIVGVNKIATRPNWDGAGFVPRKMMNLSSSFDHRVIDGWNAARFVQRIRALLETPALIFIDG